MDNYNIEELTTETVSEWKRTLFDINARFVRLARIDDGKYLKKLLDLGFDINHKNEAGMTPLWQIMRSSEKLIDAFLANGADVNVVNNFGRSLLFNFVFDKDENSALLQKLINAGADINLQDCYGNTALSVAAEKNKTSLVKVLLEAGADVEIKSKRGYTALINAAMNEDDNPEVVKMLLEAGANIHARTIMGTTALSNTAHRRNINCLKVLLEAGADVNTVGYCGVTPLMSACMNSRDAQKGIAYIDCLLDNGADVDYEMDFGDTALDILLQNKNDELKNSHLAERMRHLMKKPHNRSKQIFEAENFDINRLSREQVAEWKHTFHDVNLLFLKLAEIDDGKHIKKLLELGFEINAKNAIGRTPLGDAGRISPLVVKEMLANGASVNVIDKFGLSPLWNAVKAKSLENVALLAEAGADINLPDNWGDTPLIFCARFGYLEMLELLLKFGAEINKTSMLQEATPLMAACVWGEDADEKNIKIVKTLIENGADLEHRNYRGQTALYQVIETPNPHRLKILVKAGADINSVNGCGWTPLMFSCALGNAPEKRLECIEILLDAGADVNRVDDNGKTAMDLLENNRCELMKNSSQAKRIKKMM